MNGDGDDSDDGNEIWQSIKFGTLQYAISQSQKLDEVRLEADALAFSSD